MLMETSRRDLLNDMTEHRPILKKKKNTYNPRFSFPPKTGIEFPKTCFVFTVSIFEIDNLHSYETEGVGEGFRLSCS